VQPVTVSNGRVKFHDVAAHVVFNYVFPLPVDDPMLFSPDRETFKGIIQDLKQIKELCESNQVSTSGDLNIHPGFTQDVPGFKKAISDFVAKYCVRSRLQVVSFMGLSNGFEPWVFFSVARGSNTPFAILRQVGGFKTNPETTAQALSFVGPTGDGEVVPAPSTSVTEAFGLSTALLFPDNGFKQSNLPNPAFPNTTVERLKPLVVQHVADFVANPSKANTISTDCVSCHTESTRRHILKLPQTPLGFALPDGISGVTNKLLPKDKWNVRNFGWGLNFFDGRKFVPTVTMRAANEAAESADFINRVYLANEN
jgi:hypothetical protein